MPDRANTFLHGEPQTEAEQQTLEASRSFAELQAMEANRVLDILRSHDFSATAEAWRGVHGRV